MITLQSKLQQRLKKKYDLYILLIIGVINAYVLSPSIINSLGITSLEDGPIQPAVVYKNFEFFENDFHANEFQRLMWTTSTKWVPALLYKYVNLDPIFFHLFFTYSQTVLIILGVFFLTKALSESRATSYIAVSFIIIFSPYFNNFGSYGDQFFMPYGTWISIGPLLLAWASAIKSQQKAMFFWLFIGASIHPGMALCASLCILAFSPHNKNQFKRKTTELVLVFFFPILFSLIAATIRYFATASAVPEIWYTSLKQVYHWYAWKLTPEAKFFETTSYSILLVFSTFIITQSSLFAYSEKIKKSTYKITIVFILAYIVQAVTFQMNVDELYSISFGRVSIFTSIFSIVIYAICLSFLLQDNLNTINVFKSTLIIYILLIPSYLNLAILGIFLVYNEIKTNRNHIKFSLVSSIFVMTSLFFARANYNDSWIKGSIFDFIPFALRTVPNYLPLRMLEYISLFVWALILIIFLIFNVKKISEHRKFLMVLILISLTSINLTGRYILSERRSEIHKDWVSTQLWALENTSTKAKFIVNSGYDTYESWTTLSKRPRLIADLQAGFLYFYTKEDQAYDEKRALLPRAPNSKSDTLELERFYILFGHEFSAEYLVWKTDFTQLSFKEVYKNSKYVVYELPRK